VCNEEIVANGEIDSISPSRITISIRVVPICVCCLTDFGGDPEQFLYYLLDQLDSQPKLRLIHGGGEGSSESARPNLRLVDCDDDES
jgi:hypothetical protein